MNTNFSEPTKEYNRQECKVVILENVIFTKLIELELAKQPLSNMAESYLLVSIQQNLPIKFSALGMVAHKKDFDYATEIITNSVLYN
jgi:hypothetical protein